MKWQLRSDAPIYSQLIEHIKLGIVSGEFPPGGKLPSVRDLAGEAGVNPNTMQRAFTELEREGLVNAQRTSGRYVTEDHEMIEETKKDLARAKIKDFLEAMTRLGYGADEIAALVSEQASKEGS
ncbi:MAG: GntR family transcriptional regulator [Clostridiales bacterium]|jgi:DNA-binding transcriptional regulator YhcF (GntR family)|nr:GntR family transcriptional regulator [Clostridiales bacterium]